MPPSPLFAARADRGRTPGAGPGWRPAPRRRLAGARRQRPELMRLGVLGAGAVGVRALRQWLATPDVDELVVADRVADAGPAASRRRWPAGAGGRRRPSSLARRRGAGPSAAARRGRRGAPARRHRGRLDRPTTCATCATLLAPGVGGRGRAAARWCVGAGFMPGLTCLLARLRGGRLRHGRRDPRGQARHRGPACARQHHRALGSTAVGWNEDGWFDRPGGSGRELCWFPDPIGALDCYRAGLGDPLLLVPAFAGVAAGVGPGQRHAPGSPDGPPADAVAHRPRRRHRCGPGRGPGRPRRRPGHRGARRPRLAGGGRGARGRGGRAGRRRGAASAGSAPSVWPIAGVPAASLLADLRRPRAEGGPLHRRRPRPCRSRCNRVIMAPCENSRTSRPGSVAASPTAGSTSRSSASATVTSSSSSAPCPPPDLGDDLDEDGRSVALAARIRGFREDTREQRVRIAREAEHRFERKVSWGATLRRARRSCSPWPACRP